MWLFQDDKDTKFESNSQRRPSQLVRCFRLFQDDKDTKFESNSQLFWFWWCKWWRCFRTTKIQNLRAIHNSQGNITTFGFVVSGRQRYKIWEQFTTAKMPLLSKRLLFQDDKDTKFESNSQLNVTGSSSLRPLFQDDKDTKFESNSQPAKRLASNAAGCFRTTKIQNLRAIHNDSNSYQWGASLFQDDKDTKFESNSQPGFSCLIDKFVVSGRQRYKIWEQFTTHRPHYHFIILLFQDDKDTKFESNSQHAVRCIWMKKSCFRTTKIQNLRAIHNAYGYLRYPYLVVSGRQRYKIWEQFTTVAELATLNILLFQDDKDTKFESNSQLGSSCLIDKFGCFRTTKIQNLRAIHNCLHRVRCSYEVVSGRQRYKIWEQFTTLSKN